MPRSAIKYLLFSGNGLYMPRRCLLSTNNILWLENVHLFSLLQKSIHMFAFLGNKTRLTTIIINNIVHQLLHLHHKEGYLMYVIKSTYSKGRMGQSEIRVAWFSPVFLSTSHPPPPFNEAVNHQNAIINKAKAHFEGTKSKAMSY
jgi:hypothetical protein